MATPFRKTAEFLRGREAEQRVAARLQRDGWGIIPSYDYSGPDGEKAPTIQWAHEGIVLPDFGIAKSGTLLWAEVKAKAGPTFTVITQTEDHGIGLRKWTHYRRVERETGCHVWLIIIEECSQMLLAESLDQLGRGRCYPGESMDPGGMMFWPRVAFGYREKLHSLFGEGPLPFLRK